MSVAIAPPSGSLSFQAIPAARRPVGPKVPEAPTILQTNAAALRRIHANLRAEAAERRGADRRPTAIRLRACRPGARLGGDDDGPVRPRPYARRTGAERGVVTAKDPATNDITRGWCRLTGPAPSCCSPRPCSSSAASASWQPGIPGRKKTSAAQPPACPRNPQTTPQDPRRPRHRATLDPAGTSPNSATAASTHRAQTAACPEPAHASAKQASEHEPHRTRQQPTVRTRTSDLNVKIGPTETWRPPGGAGGARTHDRRIMSPLL
jgi:hypothetical protein